MSDGPPILIVDHLSMRFGGLVAVDDLLHLRLDLRQVVQAERRLAREVVIEAVVDGRADRDLRAGEQLLHRLREHGVEYISFTEQYLNSLGPWQQAIEGFLASIAKQESVRRGQRVRAGHERVRLTGTKSGKAIGRPALPAATVTRIKNLRAAGMSFRKIAAELQVPVATVHLHCSDKKAPAE